MIEIIAVLVILVITAAVGIPNVDDYIENAEQSARMTTARTIFYAAQNAMTKRFSQDSLYWNDSYTADAYLIPGGVERLDVGAPTEQQKADDKKLICLKLDRLTSGSRTNEPLYRLLEPYLTDKSILSDTILIEFNRETGKVLSAFYSDDDGVASFNYNVATDVCAVDDASLRAKRMGYFGVETTGEPIQPPEPEGLQVVLRDYGLKGGSGVYDFGLSDNAMEKQQVVPAPLISPYTAGINNNDCYGLLTVECTLPQRDENLHYTLLLRANDSNGQGQGTLNLYFSGDETWNPGQGNKEVAFYKLSELKKTQGGQTRDLAVAFANPIEKELGKTQNAYTRKTVAYAYTKGTNTVVVFVLDCAYPGFSITENYPELFKTGNGHQPVNADMEATLSVVGGSAGSSAAYPTEGKPTVQTLFAGPNDDKKGDQYEIGTIRHLNNIRYEKSTAGKTYWQSAPIPALDYNAFAAVQPQQVNFAPLCSTTPFAGTYVSAKSSATGLTTTFVSTGTDGGYKPSATTCAILDLKIDVTGSGNAGLFHTIAKYALVDGVCLAYDKYPNWRGEDSTAATVRGKGSTGGIAGKNEGTIDNCTVTGRIQSTGGNAGGIAGENAGNGIIQRCYVGADVLGTSAAGGIVGRISENGQVLYCEVGTASRDRVQVGTPYFGAWVPRASYNYNPTNRKYATANNTFKVTVGTSGKGAGGIAGVMITDNGLIEGCVNAAKVNGDPIEDKDPTGGQRRGTGAAGGIVGYMGSEPDIFPKNSKARVLRSYNAGAVYGPNEAGGVAGFIYFCGELQYCYNTGFVNRVVGEGMDDDNGTYVYQPGAPRNISTDDVNTTGGIVGLGWGRGASDRDNIQVHNCYNMQYAGDKYGGAFGVMYNCTVGSCAFLGNVLNTEAKYNLTRGSLGFNRYSDTGLSRVTSVDLQDGKSTKLFSDGVFTPGNEYGVGAFHYTLPYLSMTNNLCALGTSFHRTPWNRVQESNGLFYLSDNGDHVKLQVFTANAVNVTVDLTLANKGNTYYRGFVLNIKKAPDAVTATVMDTSKSPAVPVLDQNKNPVTMTFTRKAIDETTEGYEREWKLGFTSVYVSDADLLWEGWEGIVPADVGRVPLLTVSGILEGPNDPDNPDDADGTFYAQDRVDRQVRLDATNFAVDLIDGPLPTGKGSDIECAYVKVTMPDEQIGSFIVNVECAFDPANPSAYTRVKQIAVNISDINHVESSLAASIENKHYLVSLNGRAELELFPFYCDGDDYYIVLYTSKTDSDYPDVAFPNETGIASGRPVKAVLSTSKDDTTKDAAHTITAP